MLKIICKKAGDSMKDMILLAGTLIIFGSMYFVMEKVDGLLKNIFGDQSGLGKK